MKKLYFSEIPSWKKEQKNLEKTRKAFNFLNLHDLYWFSNDNLVRKSLLSKENINFIDGFMISLFLSVKYLKRIIRTSGPVFTRKFFENKKLSGGKKHFFIGNLRKEDIRKLLKKFSHLDREKLFYHNPPYIKDIKFPPEEIRKISRMVNKKKPDYVWVGLGAPKQNILTEDLFIKTNAKCFFNIGAALDFILDKKKEAPLIVRELGIEWLYRLITDFKHTFPKVGKSFIGLFYLPKVVKVRKN